MIQETHNKIEEIVREIVEKIKEEYSDKLNEVASELNFNYTLDVETHNKNPLMVYPVMYVDREELIEEIEERLAKILSETGLRVKPQPILIPYHKVKNNKD